MKRLLLTTLTVFIANFAFACSCNYGGNFLYSSQFSGTIVKAKVIDHVYHTENEKRFTNLELYNREIADNKFDPYYGTGESITIEILELIRGNERRKIIEIFSSDGADCRAGTSGFIKGKTYIMSIYQPKRRGPKLPNETDSDYAIEGCSENWIEYLPETNEVFGLIKGKSYRKKARKYSYGKLIKKIAKQNS